MTSELLLATALAATFSCAAYAQGVPVYDNVNNLHFIQTIQQGVQLIQQGGQIISEAKATVGALTNIPQEAIGSIQGLLTSTIQNPLNDINLNLSTLMSGAGTGTCTGSAGILAMQQYAPATGGDFMGASMNGSAARLAGLQACTQQMIQAQQQRLNEIPGLLDELKACTDVACTTAIQGRLQYENTMQTAQTNQSIMLVGNAQMQRWTAEDQIVQKQRADEQQLIQSTGGNASGAAAVSQTTQPPIQQPTFAPMFGQADGG